MKKKSKWIIISTTCVTLACVVIGLLIFGIIQHTETGLLKVCWDENGFANYVDTSQLESVVMTNGSCDMPEELVWPQEQIPLSIAPVSSQGLPLAPNTNEVRILSQVISDINIELGFDLFMLDEILSSQGSVVVRFGGDIETGNSARETYPGYVQHIKLGVNLYLCRVCIRSDSVSEDRELYDVLKHELLHVSGLGHDDFTASIMYPLTHSSWNSDNLGRRITDHDRSLLRKLY